MDTEYRKLRAALQAFVDAHTKVSGFQATHPILGRFSGEVLKGKAALRETTVR